MPTLPEFDELDTIRTKFQSEIFGSLAERKFNRKRCEDMIFDLLTMSYVYGLEVAGLDLERDIPVDRDKMREAIYAKTAGKDFIERLNDHIKTANGLVSAAQGGTVEQLSADIKAAESLVNDLSVLAETEAHRVINDAIMDSGDKYLRDNPGANLNKTWVTMNDDRVRETHDYLEGVTVPYNARFYTFDGDSAMFPGDFQNAENNVNCRCILTLSPVNN